MEQSDKIIDGAEDFLKRGQLFEEGAKKRI
jgi:hypothetical protein